MQPTEAPTPYEQAVQGFREYWYPLCASKEAGKRPSRWMLCGEPIAIVRVNGKVRAMIDECPHRGARLSLGKFEFPGRAVISCRFHGWTFDLEGNGNCVAALTDGPDSPVVGKVRLRMFPIEERKGIVWIWMGRTAPVPLEEDVPNLMLREDTNVLFRHRIVKGNWRYHAEGGSGGHFQMLHRDSLSLLFQRLTAHGARPGPNVLHQDEDGEYLVATSTDRPATQATYPGLGTWPPDRPWRFIGKRGRRKGPLSNNVHGGLKTSVTLPLGIRLPGLLRVPHFPMQGSIYYEWYIPIDADWYLYFQVNCFWPSSFLSRIWMNLWMRAWAIPMRDGRFNDQDKGMVLQATQAERRLGHNDPTLLYRPDFDPIGWREYANRSARGVAGNVDTSAAVAEVATETG